VLSDAEALCSRVAILAKSRLVASGRLSEILAFGIRGWELVVANVSDEILTKYTPRILRAQPIGGGRFALELPAGASPEQLMLELTALGGQLVSLNPLRETLEDFFVERVEQRQ
jgi:ABC-2 type transport system ATP-binding protein